MAAGDSPIVAGATKANYVAQNSKLIGEAFDTALEITASNSNILGHLQGPVGSGKLFAIKTDLTKGAMETVNMSVATSLGQAGRRGTQQAVNFEEQLIHNSWNVQIDSLRVVVGWNEITRVAATTGQSWQEVYAEMCGERLGQIEQEDMLMRLRQRSGATNTVRPSNRTSLNALTYDDTLDTATAGRAIGLLSQRGGKPAKLTQGSAGMPINGYVALGADAAMEGLWQDPTFTNALLHAHVDGKDNPYWSGDIPMWKGTAFKRWYVVDHDNPGPIGSSIIPRAVLGDASATADGSVAGSIASGTTTFDIYGGGRTQTALGNAKTIYKPFEYFFGCNKLFGETITFGTDAGPYHFIVIDPADGKWCLYQYRGSTDIGSNGYKITVHKRLGAATSGSAYTTLATDGLGGAGATTWTYDASVNKEDFPVGSLIVQVNTKVVPVTDVFVLGAEAGAKCYGKVKNQRIQQQDDYGALMGKGVWSIYGSDMKKDTQSAYRGFVRIQCAYELTGYSLPQV